ncbi:MAG: hypothetical protein V3R73_06485, partial [Sphingomonadales bacterium]
SFAGHGLVSLNLLLDLIPVLGARLSIILLRRALWSAARVAVSAAPALLRLFHLSLTRFCKDLTREHRRPH